MKICMVTPHLPPDQAANALLPHLLGEGLRAREHEVSFVSFEPRYGVASPREDVTYISRPANGWVRKVRLSQMATFLEVFRKVRPVLRLADVVHVHSNTFMNQVSALVARAANRPFILTHYGTEIWHFRKRRPIDPFLWMNDKASHVTFYSRLLLERSLELGVGARRRSVVYPPAEKRFHVFSPGEREEARRALGIGKGPLLINVKRLHPLAGQRYLVEAMPEILGRFPDAQAWFAGEGESRAELESLIAEKKLDFVRPASGLGGQPRASPLLRRGRSLRSSIEARSFPDRRRGSSGLRHARGHRRPSRGKRDQGALPRRRARRASGRCARAGAVYPRSPRCVPP